MGTDNLPESTAADGNNSAEVCTKTSPCMVKLPMVKPAKVTTNADGGMTAPAAVMVKDVAVVALHVPFNPTTLLLPSATAGVTYGAKKPEGYVSVMVPPRGTRVPGVKLKVTGTPVFPALRSAEAIVNAMIAERIGVQVNPSPPKPASHTQSPLWH